MSEGEGESGPELSSGGEGQVEEVVAQQQHRQEPEAGVAFEGSQHQDGLGVGESAQQTGEGELDEHEGGELGQQVLHVEGLGVLEEVEVEVGIFRQVVDGVEVPEGSGVEGEVAGEELFVGDEAQ